MQHSLSWVYYQKKMKTLNSKRCACPVSCSSIYSCQEMEAAQVSLHRWVGTEDGDWDCVCVCVCIFSSVWAHTHTEVFSSVAQSCPTLCDPMNRSMPGLPVHHQLPEFTQTQVHRVGDAIQPSHPLSSPSPPAPNPSQHQGLFQ